MGRTSGAIYSLLGRLQKNPTRYSLDLGPDPILEIRREQERQPVQGNLFNEMRPIAPTPNDLALRLIENYWANLPIETKLGIIAAQMQVVR